MREVCEIFKTEYRRHFIKRKHVPEKSLAPRDYFSERIEEGQIDPQIASIPNEIDEKAEKLVYKQILDNQRSVYQVHFKNHWKRDVIEKGRKQVDEMQSTNQKEKESGFENALLEYIHKLYFDPHKEKVLAPPVTAKRIFGYAKPKLLHASLSTYQESHGRTGGLIMLENTKITPVDDKLKNPTADKLEQVTES